jgi:hypothetical protein
MEGGLERNNSMFGKDSIISKVRRAAASRMAVFKIPEIHR